MTRSIQEVFNEIESWGPNIAEELAKRGIKGKQDCAEACPMATYILRETDDAEVWEIEVNGWTTYYRTGDLWFDVISNPDNMSDFIEEFDEGAYPFLREEEKEEIPDPPIDPDQYPLW